MPDQILATVKCPLCGGKHINPEVHYLDGDLSNMQIICPELTQRTCELYSFSFKSLRPSETNPEGKIRVLGGKVG